MSPTSQNSLTLPPSVVSKTDISRLVREIEQVDNELTTAAVRTKTGVQSQYSPVISQQLTDFLQINNLTLGTDSVARTDLVKRVRDLKDQAPVMHMTFAVTADSASLQVLVEWLRTSIHPQTLVSVGLQPGLVAGAYIRTPNHVYDMSLRSKLKGRHEALVAELEALRGNS